MLVVATLAGVVSSQQGGYQFTGSVPAYVLGSVVTSSIVLELGPVLTAFVFISRVGARITAELGSMRVSEQIDALHTLGRDPVRVLAAPRLLAGMLVLPILTGIADTVGVYAGMVTAGTTLHLGPETFLYGVRLFWRNWDLFYSLLKGFAFGFTIPLVSAHMGLLTTGGAEGLGPRDQRRRRVHDHRGPRHGRALSPALARLSVMIEYVDVHKWFERPVLRGVSLQIDTGELLGIVGPSGGGKSVLLKTTIGLIVPDRGDVLIDGQSIHYGRGSARERCRRGIGYVFQYSALFDSMNVFDNVVLGIPEDELKTLPMKRRWGASCARCERYASLRGSCSASSPRSSPVACASASASRGRSSAGRASCSTTSRSPGWTRKYGRRRSVDCPSPA